MFSLVCCKCIKMLLQVEKVRKVTFIFTTFRSPEPKAQGHLFWPLCPMSIVVANFKLQTTSPPETLRPISTNLHRNVLWDPLSFKIVQRFKLSHQKEGKITGNQYLPKCYRNVPLVVLFQTC